MTSNPLQGDRELTEIRDSRISSERSDVPARPGGAFGKIPDGARFFVGVPASAGLVGPGPAEAGTPTANEAAASHAVGAAIPGYGYRAVQPAERRAAPKGRWDDV